MSQQLEETAMKYEYITHMDGVSFGVKHAPKGWQVVYMTASRMGAQGGFYATRDEAVKMCHTYCTP